MSQQSREVQELAAKILPGMQERAQIYFNEATKGRPYETPSAALLFEVMLKTMADELACVVIGMRK